MQTPWIRWEWLNQPDHVLHSEFVITPSGRRHHEKTCKFLYSFFHKAPKYCENPSFFCPPGEDQTAGLVLCIPSYCSCDDAVEVFDYRCQFGVFILFCIYFHSVYDGWVDCRNALLGLIKYSESKDEWRESSPKVGQSVLISLCTYAAVKERAPPPLIILEDTHAKLKIKSSSNYIFPKMYVDFSDQFNVKDTIEASWNDWQLYCDWTCMFIKKNKSCCTFKYFSLSSSAGSRTETTRCCKRCGVTSKFSPKKMKRMRRRTPRRDRSQEPPSSDPKPEWGFPTGSLWWGGRWSVTVLWDWSLDRRSQRRTRTSNMCRKRSYLSELSWM